MFPSDPNSSTLDPSFSSLLEPAYLQEHAETSGVSNFAQNPQGRRRNAS
jgi:hypothetical protein